MPVSSQAGIDESTLVAQSREGDTVAAGQVVGRVGATGRVTGPHLHWAVRVADARIDPLALLALLGEPASGSRP